MKPKLGLRVAIIGISGSGKTFLAEKISEETGMPHSELDAEYWGTNWTPALTEVFVTKLQLLLREPTWIIEGDYDLGRDILLSAADSIVWLDLNLGLVLRRALIRSIKRGVSRQVLWHQNREPLSMTFFSRNSILLWILKAHAQRRRLYPEVLVQAGKAGKQIIRLRTSQEVDRFLRQFSFAR